MSETRAGFREGYSMSSSEIRDFCGTVLQPDRTNEIARFCGAAGAQHLRAALVLGAVLAILALLPVVIGAVRSRPAARALTAGWAVIFLFVTVVGLLSLTVIEYSPPREVLDL